MTLAEALQAFSTAVAGLVSALTVAGITEAPDLASILNEALELPDNIVDCAALAADLGLL